MLLLLMMMMMMMMMIFTLAECVRVAEFRDVGGLTMRHDSFAISVCLYVRLSVTLWYL